MYLSMKVRTEDELFRVLGPIVEELRVASGISQNQLIKALGLGKNTYQHVKKVNAY